VTHVKPNPYLLRSRTRAGSLSPPSRRIGLRGRIDRLHSEIVFDRRSLFLDLGGRTHTVGTILTPALAKARAHARPMPLVEPVTSAVLTFRIPMLFTVFWLGVTIK
jgi:hypothetical protein